MLLRKEKRMREAEGLTEGWRPLYLPGLFRTVLASRSPACQWLASRVLGSARSPLRLPGEIHSWLHAELGNPGVGAPGWGSSRIAAQTRMGWTRGSPPRALRTKAESQGQPLRAHALTHTRAARRRTEPPETARCSTGRTSFRNSLARVTTNLPGWEKRGGCRTAAVWEDGSAACGGDLGPAAEKSASETTSRAG